MREIPRLTNAEKSALVRLSTGAGMFVSMTQSSEVLEARRGVVRRLKGMHLIQHHERNINTRGYPPSLSELGRRAVAQIMAEGRTNWSFYYCGARSDDEHYTTQRRTPEVEAPIVHNAHDGRTR